MTGPTKPPRARKATKPPAAAPSISLVPFSLSSDEVRLLERYRATAEIWRSDFVAYANTSAIIFPVEGRASTVPPTRIRLATDDGKKVPK